MSATDERGNAVFTDSILIHVREPGIYSADEARAFRQLADLVELMGSEGHSLIDAVFDINFDPEEIIIRAYFGRVDG